MKQRYRKLTPYPAVRVRTEIYLGSRVPVVQGMIHFDGTKLIEKEFTFVPALLTYFREVLDNALDEVVGRQRGKSIWVEFNPTTLEFLVEDDGSGIPIQPDADLGGIPAVILLSEVHAGSNFDEHELARLGITTEHSGTTQGRGKWAGINGIGGSVVNFTSEWFQLDVWRERKHFRQIWNEGTENFKTSGHRIKSSNHHSGTRIGFKPSAKVFQHLLLPEELIHSHLWMIAASNSSLRVHYNGELLRVAKTKDPIGTTLLEDKQIASIDISDENFSATYYLIPGFSEQETVFSLVNNVPTYQGGTHVDAFKSIFYAAMIEALNSKVKRENLIIKRDDIASGLLIFNVTRMDAPEFTEQSKSRLQSPSASQHIKAGFHSDMILAVIRRNPEWIEEIIERCRHRSAAKDLRDVNNHERGMTSKVAKLMDATSRHRVDCVLFLAEGDSAIKSGFVPARDKTIHGGLPLRGKVDNVWNMTPNDILNGKKKKNDKKEKDNAYRDIMSALGLRFGQKANHLHLRYGRCFIATDEDEDGKHITNLLINFFFKFWPELFDPKYPFFFKFCTPFITLRKGKTVKYVYGDEYETFKSEKYKGWDITRAKGLGSLLKADWQHSLLSPKLIPMVDDGKLKDILSLLFDPNLADERKDWLSK